MSKLFIVSLLFFGQSSFAAEGERIKGFKSDMSGITFHVSSGGCTKKEDFTLVQKGSAPIELTLKRNRFDGCEAFFPFGTEIKFTWQEIGSADGFEYVITNPLATIRYFDFR